MKTRVFAAIAAAVLALVGIGAVALYAASAQSRAFGGATLVTVYRVTGDISANSSSDEVKNQLEEARLPNAAIPKGAVKELADIEGLKTTVPLVAGEILVTARFDAAGSSAASGSAVPKGLQEVTIALGPDAAGGVEAGHRVGVIVTAESQNGERQGARMIAQSILVTGVNASGDGTLVTLAVDGKMATQVSAAVRFGQVRLSIQNDDTNKESGGTYDAGKLI